MIKIIVVDDDNEMHNTVRQIIRKVIFNIDSEIKIYNFSKMCGELETEILDNSCPKIYLLDIELANSGSGIQIAKKIREKDWDSQIIFMTNHDKMFETVYRNVYQVFDFIEKFHDFSPRLEKDLKAILNMKFDNKIFYYSGRNADLQLYMKSILYIHRDSTERKVMLVSDKNTFIISLSLNEVLEKLDDRFAMCHRSCIVNKSRVQKYDWTSKEITLDTGKVLKMLSKKYKKEIEGK